VSEFYVYSGERWPDYSLEAPDEDEPEYNIKLSDEELADFNRVQREYEAWQKRLADFKESIQ
jgi:hypothetical protein